jgi:hypothetical protein
MPLRIRRFALANSQALVVLPTGEDPAAFNAYGDRALGILVPPEEGLATRFFRP